MTRSNLDKDEALAIAVDKAIQAGRQADWTGNKLKIKLVKNAIKSVLEYNFGQVSSQAADVSKPGIDGVQSQRERTEEQIDTMADELVDLAKNQYEYKQD